MKMNDSQIEDREEAKVKSLLPKDFEEKVSVSAPPLLERPDSGVNEEEFPKEAREDAPVVEEELMEEKEVTLFKASPRMASGWIPNERSQQEREDEPAWVIDECEERKYDDSSKAYKVPLQELDICTVNTNNDERTQMKKRVSKDNDAGMKQSHDTEEANQVDRLGSVELDDQKQAELYSLESGTVYMEGNKLQAENRGELQDEYLGTIDTHSLLSESNTTKGNLDGTELFHHSPEAALVKSVDPLTMCTIHESVESMDDSKLISQHCDSVAEGNSQQCLREHEEIEIIKDTDAEALSDENQGKEIRTSEVPSPFSSSTSSERQYAEEKRDLLFEGLDTINRPVEEHIRSGSDVINKPTEELIRSGPDAEYAHMVTSTLSTTDESYQLSNSFKGHELSTAANAQKTNETGALDAVDEISSAYDASKSSGAHVIALSGTQDADADIYLTPRHSEDVQKGSSTAVGSSCPEAEEKRLAPEGQELMPSCEASAVFYKGAEIVDVVMFEEEDSGAGADTITECRVEELSYEWNAKEKLAGYDSESTRDAVTEEFSGRRSEVETGAVTFKGESCDCWLEEKQYIPEEISDYLETEILDTVPLPSSKTFTLSAAEQEKQPVIPHLGVEMDLNFIPTEYHGEEGQTVSYKHAETEEALTSRIEYPYGNIQPATAEYPYGNIQPATAEYPFGNIQPATAEYHFGNIQPATAEYPYGNIQPATAEYPYENIQQVTTESTICEMPVKSDAELTRSAARKDALDNEMHPINASGAPVEAEMKDLIPSCDASAVFFKGAEITDVLLVDDEVEERLPTTGYPSVEVTDRLILNDAASGDSGIKQTPSSVTSAYQPVMTSLADLQKETKEFMPSCDTSDVYFKGDEIGGLLLTVEEDNQDGTEITTECRLEEQSYDWRMKDESAMVSVDESMNKAKSDVLEVPLDGIDSRTPIQGMKLTGGVIANEALDGKTAVDAVQSRKEIEKGEGSQSQKEIEKGEGSFPVESLSTEFPVTETLRVTEAGNDEISEDTRYTTHADEETPLGIQYLLVETTEFVALNSKPTEYRAVEEQAVFKTQELEEEAVYPSTLYVDGKTRPATAESTAFEQQPVRTDASAISSSSRIDEKQPVTTSLADLQEETKEFMPSCDTSDVYFKGDETGGLLLTVEADNQDGTEITTECRLEEQSYDWRMRDESAIVSIDESMNKAKSDVLEVPLDGIDSRTSIQSAVIQLYDEFGNTASSKFSASELGGEMSVSKKSSFYLSMPSHSAILQELTTDTQKNLATEGSQCSDMLAAIDDKKEEGKGETDEELDASGASVAHPGKGEEYGFLSAEKLGMPPTYNERKIPEFSLTWEEGTPVTERLSEFGTSPEYSLMTDSSALSTRIWSETDATSVSKKLDPLICLEVENLQKLYSGKPTDDIQVSGDEPDFMPIGDICKEEAFSQQLVWPKAFEDYDESTTGRKPLLDKHARVILKRRIHKKTVITAGCQEETVVTEDTHVEQDNDTPKELHAAIQAIIEQFVQGNSDFVTVYRVS